MKSLRARQPGRPLRRILFWHFWHFVCFLFMVPFYRYRAWGAHRVPGDGPVLLVSNHQSFLDPIAVGLACHHRQFCALARSTLFEHAFFDWLIRGLNAIPVVQDSADKGAMRRCIEVLNDRQALLIFPEGARTLDGATQPFAPGTMLLIKRARPLVVPVAIEGAFDAWPRQQSRPRLSGRIHVRYGDPIDPGALIDMGAKDALRFLQERIEAMRCDLARGISEAADRL